MDEEALNMSIRKFLKKVGITSQREIEQAVRDTIRVNELRDSYVRLVFSRGVGTLGLDPFKCPVPGAVIIADSIALYPPELYDRPVTAQSSTPSN